MLLHVRLRWLRLRLALCRPLRPLPLRKRSCRAEPVRLLLLLLPPARLEPPLMRLGPLLRLHQPLRLARRARLSTVVLAKLRLLAPLFARA